MHWLFLLFAIAALFFVLTTTHAGWLLLALLAALVCLLLWIRGLYRARFGDTFTAMPRALHPSELQAMRDQLRAGSNATPPPIPRPEGQSQP